MTMPKSTQDKIDELEEKLGRAAECESVAFRRMWRNMQALRKYRQKIHRLLIRQDKLEDIRAAEREAEQDARRAKRQQRSGHNPYPPLDLPPDPELSEGGI